MKLAGQKKKVALIEEHREAEEGKNSLFGFLHGGEKRPLRIAFINDKDSRTSAWAYGHRLGWQALKEKYGSQVKISVYNHCDTPEAVRDALPRQYCRKTILFLQQRGRCGLRRWRRLSITRKSNF